MSALQKHLQEIDANQRNICAFHSLVESELRQLRDYRIGLACSRKAIEGNMLTRSAEGLSTSAELKGCDHV